MLKTLKNIFKKIQKKSLLVQTFLYLIIYLALRSIFQMIGWSIWKIRTMVQNNLINTNITTLRDSRITKNGAFLRKYKLDELPQFFNVLIGNMSIVGPRPERPDFTTEYEQAIPGYGRRHDIPPGITGLAQVNGRYHTDPTYKLGHDLQYLVNWSPVLDIQILFKTIWIVIRRDL